MYIPSEIIILFFLISFLVYTMPNVLVVFSKTFYGKAILILLMILTTLYNPTGGLLIAMLIIFLSEFNYAFNNGTFYEGFGISSTSDKMTSAPPKKSRGMAGAGSEAGTSTGSETGTSTGAGSEAGTSTGTGSEAGAEESAADTDTNPENFRKNHCDNGKLKDDKGNVVEMSNISTVFPKLKFDKTDCNPCDTTCAFTITDGKEKIQTEEELKPRDSAQIGVSKEDTNVPAAAAPAAPAPAGAGGSSGWEGKYQLTFAKI